MRDQINEFQKSGILQIYNYSSAKGEKIEIVINRLIDWLLYNLEETRKYLKEMDYLGATIVIGDGPGNDDVDIMEQNIIELEEAKAIIKSVQNTISEFDEQTFDVYIDRYHNNLIYSRIADFEDISEITVKRIIKRIRQEVSNGFDRDDIIFDQVLNLRKKLNSIKFKKVS